MGSVEVRGGTPDYSPQPAQEIPLPLKNGFPKDNLEFLRYLAVDKVIKGVGGVESLLAINDVQRATVEFFKLMFSGIYQGFGVPRGEGTVVIATGFGTHPAWYYPTAKFFERLGYEPKIYDAPAVLNIAPVEHLIDDFMDFLSKQSGKVKLFGHSKGGLLSFATYVVCKEEFVDKVEHVVFVGAPKPEWVNIAIGLPYFATQLGFQGDDFKFAAEILNNSDIENVDGVTVTSIGNPRDAIIRGPMIGKPSEQYTVDCSHMAMHCSRRVLKLSACRFAEFDSEALKVA